MSNSNLNLTNGDYTVKTGQYFSRGWEIFKQYGWGFIGFGIVITVISIIAAQLPYPLGADAEGRGNLVYGIISPILLAGFYIVAFKIAKNRPRNFNDFFRGFNKFWLIFIVNFVGNFLILISILIAIIIVIGIYLTIDYFFSVSLLIENLLIKEVLNFWLILGVIIGILIVISPGMYLGLCYSFSVPLVIEKRINFWTALETSRKLVTKKWFSFLGFICLLSFLNLGGLLCLIVGLLVTVPLTFCIVVAAYEDIVGLNGVEPADTTVPI